MIKIAHEVPYCLLKDIEEWTDYDYCLGHLLDKNETYAEHFRTAKKRGRKVILDNSVFELESPINAKDMVRYIEMIEPDEYIIPDVLDNTDLTIAYVENWALKYGDLPGRKIGVIQGKTEEEAFRCWKGISEHVDKIAISFNSVFYEKMYPHAINQTASHGFGRIRFLEDLYTQGFVYEKRFKPIHLLGSSLPQEFKYYNNKFWGSVIESIDTSCPVMLSLHQQELSMGLLDKPEGKMVEYMNTRREDIDIELLHYNVKVFRGYLHEAK